MTITLLAPDGVAVTAQQERQGNAFLYGGGSGRPLGGRSGFRAGTASNILTATSTTWTLTPCSAGIDPGATTHQGVYGWASDANITGTVTAADATNPRKDIVYILVNDSTAGDGSGAVNAIPVYLAGTPAVTPTAPAVPARGFLVGTIDVPKVGAGSPTATLNPARIVAAGGILPVYSVADRATIAAPYVGMEIQRLDLTQLSPSGIRERWNGTNWDHLGQSEWTFNTGAGVPSNTVWGTGVMTNDAAYTTDTAFITTPGTDRLTIRDAGVYSVHLYGGFTVLPSGRTFTQLLFTNSGAPTVVRSGSPVGEDTTSVAAPNLALRAGSVLTMQTLINYTDPGLKAWSGRIRVTRIS